MPHSCAEKPLACASGVVTPDTPEPTLDPYVALTSIRTFAKVALDNDEPTLRAYELVMQQILAAAERALPKKVKAK